MPSQEIPSLDDDTPSDGALLAKASVALLGALVVGALLVLLVVASQHDTRLRHAGLALVGAPAETDQQAQMLEEMPGDQYDVRQSETFAPALEDLRSRDISAILVLRPNGDQKLYVASAASDTVARLVRQQFTTAARRSGTRLQVSDIATLPKGDSTSVTSFGLALALAITGFLGSVVLFYLARTVPFVVRAGLLAIYCLAAGIIAAVIADEVLDALTGHLVSVWLIGALIAAAVAFATQGVQAAIGAPGTLLGGVVLLILSNTSSGGANIPETLPDPLRGIGGYLPAANGIDALRGNVYFANQGVGHSLLVLGIYAAAGLLVGLTFNLLLGRQRRGTVAPLAERT